MQSTSRYFQVLVALIYFAVILSFQTFPKFRKYLNYLKESSKLDTFEYKDHGYSVFPTNSVSTEVNSSYFVSPDHQFISLFEGNRDSTTESLQTHFYNEFVLNDGPNPRWQPEAIKRHLLWAIKSASKDVKEKSLAVVFTKKFKDGTTAHHYSTIGDSRIILSRNWMGRNLTTNANTGLNLGLFQSKILN